MGAITARSGSHGVGWEVALDRDDLLPGTTARGTVAITPRGRLEARGLLAALIATEQWQFQETTMDGHGRPSTRVVTKTQEMQRLPVELAGPLTGAPGVRGEYAFEVPVPPLGPATLEATVSRLTWDLELKLDRPGQLDSGIVVAVRVLQPTALLRAGVVRVAEFALYEAADSATGTARASVAIQPMPVCVGQPMAGTVTIELAEPLDIQEIRAEIRIQVAATVSGGRNEELPLWASQLSGAGQLSAGSHPIAFRSDLPATYLPTIELPHGRTEATFHVILARAWARDPHLVRDIAVCSTTEL